VLVKQRSHLLAIRPIWMNLLNKPGQSTSAYSAHSAAPFAVEDSLSLNPLLLFLSEAMLPTTTGS
jgi:hypothetical protein